MIAAIVATKVRKPPDPRFLRVAIFLAVAFAAGTLVLHVDYLRTSIRSHRDGRTVDGIYVEGNGLSDEEVRAIRDAVETFPNVDPILGIEHTEQHSVEVYTGEVHGPLSGGGRRFLLEKIEGVWTLIDDGVLRSRMS